MGKSKTNRRSATARSKRLESQLTSLERRMLKAVTQHLGRTRSVSSHGPTEFMDIATDSEMDDLAARIAESDSLKIDEIEEALRLLRTGEYGLCQGCGRRISARRLNARPFAVLCVKCKQIQEQDQVGSRTPRPATGADIDIDLGCRQTDDDCEPHHKIFLDIETSELL